MTYTTITKCYYCNQPIEKDAEYDGWVHTDGGAPMCEAAFSWDGAWAVVWDAEPAAALAAARDAAWAKYNTLFRGGEND